MQISNYNDSHKIKKTWEDIKKLIALENRLLERIELLEKKVSNLIKLANQIESN